MDEKNLGGNPLVSIIIPTFNRAHTLRDTLDSVKKQTYQNWECIIIDDGSEDDSVNLILKYIDADKRFKFYKRNRDPKGAPTCRNIGIIEKSRGEFIQFLDSDDQLAPYCLANRLNHELRDLNVFSTTHKLNLKQSITNFIDLNLPWNIMSPLWKASFLKSTDGFDESFKLLQDPELHLRALLLLKNQGERFRFHTISEPDTYYTNQSNRKSLKDSQHAVKILNSVNKFIQKLQGYKKSETIDDQHVKRKYYMMLMEFFQAHRTEEISQLLRNEISSIREEIPRLIVFYYLKMRPIKGIGFFINQYEKYNRKDQA